MIEIWRSPALAKIVVIDEIMRRVGLEGKRSTPRMEP